MLFGRKKIEGIAKRTLNMIMESAKDSHPREFAAGLREIDGVISELVLVPGTISGNRSALLRLHNLPIDYSLVGVVHSHPSPNVRPSRNDINLFGKFGRVHVIVGFPYNEDSWRAYDWKGDEIELEVID